MKKIIATVGTSIVTNAISECKDTNDKTKLKELMSKYKNILWDVNEKKPKNVSRNVYLADENFIKDKVKDWIEQCQENSKLSAEINSCIQIDLKVYKQMENIQVCLLSTNTVLGKIAAEIIFSHGKRSNMNTIEFKFDAQKDIIEHLEVDLSLDTSKRGVLAKEGFRNLHNRILEIAEGSWSDSCLNFTGGFKAIIPIMTIISLTIGIPMYYIYEGNHNLIEFKWDEILGKSIDIPNPSFYP